LAQNPSIGTTVVVFNSAELTAAAVDERINADRIARFKMPDLCAHCFNPPGSVTAENVWKGESPVSAGSKLEIETIDCGCYELNENICGPFELRLFAVFIA